MKIEKINHHLHHYKQQEKGFGVSSTIWDLAFGTMFREADEPAAKEKKPALSSDLHHLL